MIDQFIAQEVKKMDYPIAKNHILLFYLLPGDGDKIIFNVLCNKWGISKSSLSDIINKYVDLGFVEKNECNDDKRVINLRLTAKGDKIRNELINIEEGFKEKLFKGLDTDQQKSFETLLNQVEHNINL
jgi:DNA-binding MarR family transcriptional regulator